MDVLRAATYRGCVGAVVVWRACHWIQKQWTQMTCSQVSPTEQLVSTRGTSSTERSKQVSAADRTHTRRSFVDIHRFSFISPHCTATLAGRSYAGNPTRIFESISTSACRASFLFFSRLPHLIVYLSLLLRQQRVVDVCGVLGADCRASGRLVLCEL